MRKFLIFLYCLAITLLSYPAMADVFDVTNENGLFNHLANDRTMNFLNDIDCSSKEKNFFYKNLVVEGNGYSLNGNNVKIRFTFRGKNNITFKNLTVKNFQRYDVYGGFYLGQGQANLFIDNVTFDNISTDDASEIYGGVINVTDNSELSVVNSVFQNNHQYKSSGRGDNPLG